MDDVRLAVRRLTKRPGATLASIVTLAVSIGAAAVTWSALSAVLISPLPVDDADRLMIVGWRTTQGRAAGFGYDAFKYPVLERVREATIFERVAGEWASSTSLRIGTGQMPVSLPVRFVTHDFLDVLGVPVRVGRGFTATDDARGAQPVAILSDRYWRSGFAADPAVIGRTLRIEDAVVTIVGVAASGFRGLELAEPVDIFLPFHTIGDIASPEMNYFADTSHPNSPTAAMKIIGRLRSADSAAMAIERLETIGIETTNAKLAPELTLTNVAVAAVPAAARAGMRQFSMLLGVTVALLMLIGCATVGMLLLVRTESRQAEFAMCLALGASRMRLARGVILEGGLLALAGAAMAVPVAAWLFGLIRAFQLPGGVAIDVLELSMDGQVFVSVAGSGLLAVLLVAMIAGIFGFRTDPAGALRSHSGATPGATRSRTRAALLMAQVAVALCLLAGAGLFARSIIAALSLNPGYDPSRLVTGNLSLGPHGYDAVRADSFFEALATRLRMHPAVRSVGSSVWLSGMGGGSALPIDGVPTQLPTSAQFIAVDAEYFATVGMKVISGRQFSEQDSVGAPLVGIVSESFVRLMLAEGDALGRRIRLGGSKAPEVQVVGVVPDVITSVTALDPPMVYTPFAQSRDSVRRDLVVRANDVEAASSAIMSALRELDPAVTPYALQTMQERLGQQMGSQRFGATVLGALGTIAALLTLLGTYVLADSMATRRMREMGIRAAVGATSRQLGAIVLGETGRLIGVGIVAGLGLAWLGASTIRTFLFQVQPLDPVTLGGVAAAIMLLSQLVSLRAAMRAARVDLATVLKAE